MLDELTSYVLNYGITDLVTWVAPPGLRPSERNESLETFARDVAPALRRGVDAARSGATDE